MYSQKLFSWGPTYEISRGDQLLATVSKELFTFFQCTFTVDVPGPDDLLAKGDFLDHQYVFTRNDQQVAQVAQVSKQWFTWADTYGVQITPEQDDVLILASTVVIDMACHGRQTEPVPRTHGKFIEARRWLQGLPSE
jgi:uncharacterized protein YxjI